MAAVCARIGSASATEASVLLAQHPILADLSSGRAKPAHANRATQALVDERKFACVSNARGEALAVSLLHELRRRDTPDATTGYSRLVRNTDSGTDSHKFPYRANVTPLALLLGLYCEARPLLDADAPYAHSSTQ